MEKLPLSQILGQTTTERRAFDVTIHMSIEAAIFLDLMKHVIYCRFLLLDPEAPSLKMRIVCFYLFSSSS